ncbi:MAG: protein-glutamate O-methyltransferase CheR [Alphaproteobacteria bacterium]|uniref:CheR family methyltransferase n=1 Tax=Brevundimonas sp. TaxID=1871086 RepID=UPI0012129600|nr:protein-glutamate O-methyltransferase CheR [Brevundimonas sp.]MBU3969905.1 protein-glutamate O-methyltransferase CheR [Alphaproteobacteria bacterium]MBA3049013.1 protein-glutamate O-methyltransferase CheR [Brevundimonas sp.]MBU3974752.1 protein-glutamate O-methyltransferase CheR [Alphaproteobacteria bacterium]MBU4039805.1 protein-glutamate O-methyltransferase CheR [Alphaproteobacteria bacterium]MBU4135057.1 protein-glutamate O-methyltransferase CheR [Alphaproteobacteria bacterium]
MTGPDYDHFCRLVRQRSGLVLTPEKAYLVSSRLAPVARAEGLATVAELLAVLRIGASETLLQQAVDVMATHESYFFRDAAPFEQLAEAVLPPLIAARQAQRTLRIWCAACSSGQEPYSVAMILMEMGYRLAGWKLEILATDMSEPILRKASAGLYNDFEVNRGLSPERQARWFKQEPDGWRVSPKLQQMVRFRPHNLLQGSAGLGVFDVIFCRNVLIYFDIETKRQILDHVSRAMAADGSLLLGSAETVLGVSSAVEPVPGLRGLYRPAGRTLARSA